MWVKYELLVEEALSDSGKMSAESQTKKVPYSKLLDLGQAHLKTNFNY